MFCTMRDPIGPAEKMLLERAMRALSEFPGVRLVNFALPPPSSASFDDLPREAVPTNKAVTVYTIDRTPVGYIWGREILAISVAKVPFMLICPYHNKVVEITE